MISELSLGVAILAGIISFLSPCVLPIIPGFLAYLAGRTGDEAPSRGLIFLNSIFFVLGFSVVFALIGVLLNTLLEAVAFDAQIWFSRIGGIIVIFFGLYLMGLIKLKFLEKEHKIVVRKKFRSRFLTSFIFGAAFAAGWTPCVGAALGAILGLAASQPGTAFWLLMAYAVGLGIPFLVIGLFTAQASHIIQKVGPWLIWVNRVFGLILVILGVLLYTQRLSQLANFDLLNQFLQTL